MWDIGRSDWMVLCPHGMSWVAGHNLRLSIVRLSSMCNVCFRALGCHEPNQGLYRTPPPPPNPEACTHDPHEVIQVGVMSLPWRNDSHPKLCGTFWQSTEQHGVAME